MRSPSTDRIRREYLRLDLLSQLRDELRRKFPGAESSEEARQWQTKRWIEIQRKHGL